MQPRILHQLALSGHCHRVELFLSLLGLEYQLKSVDLANGQHKTAEFLQLNPLGQVPVLEDQGQILTDSNAILVYLAKTYAPGTHWYPDDIKSQTEIQKYLSLAAGLLANGAAAARLINVFNAPLNKASCLEKAHTLLALLEKVLQTQPWLVGQTISIADIAHYSYIAHAPEGDVELTHYPAVIAWLKAIENQTGFIAMPTTKFAQHS